MKQKTLVLCTVFLLGLGLPGLQAQEAVLAAGGEASGSGGTESYSVGQIVYTINTGSNGSAAQGVQQPYEISVVLGIEEAEKIILTFSAYPNPTYEYLLLKTESEKYKELCFQLLDINGKILEFNKLEGYETNIDMSYLVPATYFIRILEENKEIKTFKIIKK